MAVKGTFSINTTISASSTHTESIDLGGEYQAALVQFQVPRTAPFTTYRQYGSTIMVGTSTSEAIAGSSLTSTITMGCGCFANVIEFKYYLYSNDSKLSDNYFKASTSGRAKLKSAYIDGTDLKLEFENDHATQQVTLQIDGTYFAWKAVSL